MFKDRSFLVKVVKDEKAKEGFDTENPGPSIDYGSVAAAAVGEAARAVGALMLVYIGADTLRQVIVHAAKTGIRPL